MDTDDALEQTQDINIVEGPGVWSYGAGTWRRVWPDPFYKPAPEVSIRYPIIPIRLTVQQAD